jgi:ABC-type transport system involved in cytochrome bd biosynthesis fused ATPase/permease subunit
MESTDRKYVSLYEQRIRLVASALTQNSKLSEEDASDLAVHVLYAIDHIPEKVR